MMLCFTTLRTLSRCSTELRPGPRLQLEAVVNGLHETPCPHPVSPHPAAPLMPGQRQPGQTVIEHLFWKSSREGSPPRPEPFFLVGSKRQTLCTGTAGLSRLRACIAASAKPTLQLLDAGAADGADAAHPAGRAPQDGSRCPSSASTPWALPSPWFCDAAEPDRL
ncbi:hypothetical protein H920_08617 [Fukomys damarensis]|uniref:Uncharacterized protein n=1 Tax=Fukomys damarensis TaxID=885580 RepID=A0A091DCZ1_FUKDA|nr:hypothetical protein H920_08617 [Fukomys damarensis]